MKRRKRLVRLHFQDETRSIEGILVGTAAGHYRLLNARMIESAERSYQLEGEQWVPRERVLFAQVIR